MRNRMFVVGSFLLLMGLAAVAAAQGRMQGQGAGQHAAQTSAQSIVTITGTIAKVSMGAGQGMPSITVRVGNTDYLVLLGPYRVLMNSKIEFELGQVVEVKGFQDLRNSNAYVATEITVGGETLVLRDTSGAPNAGAGAGMRQRGGMMGMGQAQGQGLAQGRGMMMRRGSQGVDCGFNLDLKAKTVLEGIVTSVNLAPGQGAPSFTLNVKGTDVTIIAAPFHLLIRSGFQISVNQNLSVTAYPATGVTATYVAAELQDLKTGKTLTLRDENGVPSGTPGDCPMAGTCPRGK